MSRKAIDKQQPSECRQAIWDEIRRHQAFSPFIQHDLDVCLEASSIRDYLTGLCNAGYLSTTAPAKRGADRVYWLIKDNGIEAPRVRKDGQPVTMGQGRRQIWNVMQVLKLFSPRDLAFNASTPEHAVAEKEAATYCQLLTQAGYLVPRDGGRYAFIATRWTGPQPPQIQRTKQIYDPNLKKVVWSRVEGGAE